VRLQHGRSKGLYRDLLQATRESLIVSGFRNAIQKLRLAQAISATIGADGGSVRMSDSWYYKSVEEHHGCCNDK
jgi:hypothetical protein